MSGTELSENVKRSTKRLGIAASGHLAIIIALFLGMAITRAANAQSLTFTHLAGDFVGAGYDDGLGTSARFSSPTRAAVDSAGNVYVADGNNHTIRRISSVGLVTTFAGLEGASGKNDGAGGSARFSFPIGIAIDGSGTLYVADSGNNAIRKITSAGVVTTLAGGVLSGSTDGTGAAAGFLQPSDVAVDALGNVYVTDRSNHTIRKVTSGGVVTTLAGMARLRGSSDGSGSVARFSLPEGIAIDANGDLFVADTFNSTIRKVTSGGVVTTIAGLAGSQGFVDGRGAAARFSLPRGVAIDAAGSLYVADTIVRKVTAAGVVSTLRLADGTTLSAEGVAVDGSGNLLVAHFDHTIKKVTSSGVLTTLAGGVRTLRAYDGTSGSLDGTGGMAQFFNPMGVAVDPAGTVYVTDTTSSLIRKVTAGGVTTTLAGQPFSRASADGSGSVARFSFPEGVAVDASGTVYVADTGNHTIRKITSAGLVTTISGVAGSPGSSDGVAAAARFNRPSGIAVDTAGNLYVADRSNHTIRKIDSSGAVTTVAGLAGSAGGSDGTGSAARFNDPRAVAVDSGGVLYVADLNNNAIRRIANGVVTTLAQVISPAGISVDGMGDLYVVDRGNATVHKVTRSGVVTTIGGLASARSNSAGTGSAARFSFPEGIAAGGGNLYVADAGNHSIRISRPALADVATIDSPTGPVGASRQLGTSPSTATSWEWSLVRRPSSSTAQLSSNSIRNPTFTPDVADTFVFRLTATGPTASSITLVTLSGGGVVAVKGDANGDNTVSVADVFYLISNLFTNGPAPVGSGDANGDGSLSVADVFYLISFLFTGGPAPLATEVATGSVEALPSSPARLWLGNATARAGGRVTIPVYAESDAGSPQSIAFRILYSPEESVRQIALRPARTSDRALFAATPRFGNSVSYLAAFAGGLDRGSASSGDARIIAELDIDLADDITSPRLDLTFDRDTAALGTKGGSLATIANGSLTLEDGGIEIAREGRGIQGPRRER